MFTCEIPVRFGDVDHARIVYYPRFFHFCHVAMEEAFRDALGISYPDSQSTRISGSSVTCQGLQRLTSAGTPGYPGTHPAVATGVTEVIRCTAKVRISSLRWSSAVSHPPSRPSGSMMRSVLAPWLST